MGFDILVENTTAYRSETLNGMPLLELYELPRAGKRDLFSELQKEIAFIQKSFTQIFPLFHPFILVKTKVSVIH
jgi:hypothetical protein